MKEKRILCVEVSGNCRYLREVDSLSLANLFDVREVGNYCSESSCLGWKKINNDQCKSCKKAKYTGITHEQAIRKMCDGYFKAKDEGKTESVRVEAALDALLEDNNVH